MKIFKIITIILVIIFGLSLLIPWSPTRSTISKFIMNKEGILRDLNLSDCRYYKPRIFLGATNPSYSCFTNEYLDREQQLILIQKMREILSKKGWTFSEKTNFNPWDVRYYKDDLIIHIQPYWIPVPEDSENNKLIINYQHLTQSDFEFIK